MSFAWPDKFDVRNSIEGRGNTEERTMRRKNDNNKGLQRKQANKRRKKGMKTRIAKLIDFLIDWLIDRKLNQRKRDDQVERQKLTVDTFLFKQELLTNNARSNVKIGGKIDSRKIKKEEKFKSLR